MFKWAVLILISVSQAQALDFNLNPRYDLINAKEIFINRGLLQTDLSLQTRQFKFYVDAFGEADMANETQKTWRRAKNTAYLQELYAEYTTGSVFFKMGRQAARWSDSWISPSLDVWTARRYERLFIDPLPQQLAHSTGAILSFAAPNWSVDFAAMWNIPQDTYPAPFPSTQKIAEEETLNPGLRTKFTFGGFQSSLVAARVLRKNTFGFSTNYAFEKLVPKIEVGGTINEQKDETLQSRRSAFSTFGMDIFWDNWTLTPQFTGYSSEDLKSEDSSQMIGYLSITYSKGNHEFQWQNFSNKDYTNAFYGITYTYTLKQNWGLTLLAQSYHGEDFNYASIVERETGGTLYGIRIQFNGSFRGRK